jgi:hypothetical protein
MRIPDPPEKPLLKVAAVEEVRHAVIPRFRVIDGQRYEHVARGRYLAHREHGQVLVSCDSDGYLVLIDADSLDVIGALTHDLARGLII